ncbi:MAG: DUF6094 domain-containing protein, partial [Chloroflexota bacterium]
MARLEAQAKVLYYPTDLALVDVISTYFSTNGKETRIVDPCCGRGDALAQLAGQMDRKPVTLGIELSTFRAQDAKQKLDRVLATSFYDVTRTDNKWTPRSVGLVFNNPPYDWSEFTELKFGGKRHIRHEWEFVDRCTPKIQPGGHQVILIPRSMLGSEQMLGAGREDRMGRHLAGWYEYIQVCHADNDDYRRFDQVVVLACNKRIKFKPPASEEIEAITQYAREEAEIPLIRPGDGRFVIPPVQDVVPFVFTYVPTKPEDLVRHGKACSPLKTQEFERVTYTRPVGAPFQPATPLKIGHITMLLTGEEAGVVRLADRVHEKARAMLIKGKTGKATMVVDSEAVYSDKGVYSHTKITTRQVPQATIAIVRDDGSTELLNEPKQVENFANTYVKDIAGALLERNKPLYSFQPEDREWAALAGIGVQMPKLPDREEAGLFPAQKHLAIAAARVLRKRHVAIMNAEMGFGKSLSSVAIIHLMDAPATLLTCPGHLVFKWRSEIMTGCDPQKPITARVITRPVSESYTVSSPSETDIKKHAMLHLSGNIWMAKPSWWMRLKRDLEANGARVTATTRWQIPGDVESNNDRGLRRDITIQCETLSGQQYVLDLLNKQTFNDRSDAAHKVSIAPKLHLNNLTVQATLVDRDEYTLQDFYQDYQAGRLGERAAAICSLDLAKYDAGWNTDSKAVIRHVAERKRDRKGEICDRIVERCVNCGQVIPDYGESKTVFYHHCGENRKTPLYSFNKFRRIGLARLIQKHYRGFFKLLISDEMHKSQAGTSDVGVADQRLMISIRYSVALTGTLFGGTASSLFYLLYRRVPEIRQLYRYYDVRRWVENYGYLEEEYTQEEPLDTNRGVYTNVRRMNVKPRELPGISPAIIRFLLPITLFANITDLGYDLPPLYEDVITLDMDPAQKERYETANAAILEEGVEYCLKRFNDHGWVGGWFLNNWYGPSSSFRDEVFDYQSKKIPESAIRHEMLSAVGEGEWLPKERRLAEIVKENLQDGRKTLVFIEQTGTRDIRERLVQALATLAPQANVSTLSSDDMSP